MVLNLWGWAKGYIERFHWVVAPMWYADVSTGRCFCPDGDACGSPGKHLVSGMGVAHEERHVERVWNAEDPRVRGGLVGLALMTGSDSGVVVLDVSSGPEITRARYGVGGQHILTQRSPSGGEHWFLGLRPAEAVRVDRVEFQLVEGVLVLGDGGFVALEPRHGYKFLGGRDAIASGVTDLPDAVRTQLMHHGLLDSKTKMHNDEPWRTRPGQPIVLPDKRSYNREGDLRRLVDEFGDRITFTAGLGYRVWTERGWGEQERAEMELTRYARELPKILRREAQEATVAGAPDRALKIRKWAERASARATGGLLSDLKGDERIWVPSVDHWDSEGGIAGLPVRAGIGRLVNLGTGEVERDAMTRRVSRYLGAEYEPSGHGVAATFWQLWDVGAAGGGGKWFVKYITDLTAVMGPEAIRLLQRAAGATLYGRKGVSGDTDAVFVLKGPARSGKSTFAECLLAVAGGYGKRMNENLLFGEKGNPEFTDAAILGYRALVFSEPPMKATLNTTKLKALSGGDSITGRPPFGRSEITFTPDASLWLLTNHALEFADDALWRRMKFFQFDHSLAEGAVVDDLRTALVSDPAELRLALAWMLVGAEAWGREGWGDTTAWREAAADERARHDVIEKWAGACVVYTGSMADTFTPGDMVASFNYWLSFSGEEPPSSLSKAAQKDEMQGKCEGRGVLYDKRAKVMTMGRLVG